MTESELATSRWLPELKAGDDKALGIVWQRFFEKIIVVARNRLRDVPKRVEDEEDIALSAFRRLHQMAGREKLGAIRHSDELWGLLVAITAGKVADLVRRQTADKRGGGKVRGGSAFAKKSASGESDGIQDWFTTDLSPEALLVVEEEVDRLLNLLPDPTTRQIAEMFLEGVPKTEIASTLDISRSTVYLKLDTVLAIWRAEIADE